jgi:hypothetical protein
MTNNYVDDYSSVVLLIEFQPNCKSALLSDEFRCYCDKRKIMWTVELQ